MKAHTTDPTGAAIALHNQDGAAAAAGDDDEGATPSVNSDDDSLSATAAAAAAGGAALPSLSPGPVQSPRGGGRPGGSSTGGSIATRISRALEITNLDDGHYITLEVEILQVRNLVPRKSWDAGLPALGPAWASLHEVLRAKEMPHPIVKVRGYAVRNCIAVQQMNLRMQSIALWTA